MTEALVNPAMLRWAVSRSGAEASALAERLHVSQERLDRWLSGESRPTFRQARMFAAATHVPFGFLYLSTPPEVAIGIPDLRTVGSDVSGPLDANFLDLLSDINYKHEWYKQYLLEMGADELEFVGRFTIESDASRVAEDMRATLSAAPIERNASRNWDDYLRVLIDRAEGVGIWVVRNGVVGNNTSRPLSVRQFRGFAIVDSLAPLVFINGKDAKAAQIFTLAHELAHIWTGKAGVSNVFIGRRDYGVARAAEVFCNKVAAEFLVPAEELRLMWASSHPYRANIDRIHRYFRVSRVVIARRAADLGLASFGDYASFYASEERQWQSESEDSTGGNFYSNLPLKNGARFTQTVVSEAVRGGLLLRDAGTLLNTTPATVVKYARRQAA